MDKTEKRLELLPIDFDMSLKEVAEWHDKWSVWKYGADSIKPERYYNVMSDGSLMVAKEGYELNEEKDNREEVLRLLLKMRLINQKLGSKGLFFHLLSGERERLKEERERLYNSLKQKAGLLPQRQQIEGNELNLPDEVNTPKAQKAFAKAIKEGWIKARPEGGFEWIGFGKRPSKAQLSYLCAKIYGYQYSVRNGNVGDNVPYEALNGLFGVTRLDRAMQQTYEAKKPQRWRLQIDQITE